MSVIKIKSNEWEVVDVPTHPLKDGWWVATILEVRENATGIIRQQESKEILMRGNLDPGCYIWSDGNFSCDCNRQLFFARCANEEEPTDINCGDGLYSVRIRNKRTGAIFYDEISSKDEVNNATNNA